MIIIIVVGKSGSGKSTISKLISNKGYERFEAGKTADTIYSKEKIDNFDFFMKPQNQILVAKKIERNMLSKGSQKVVISGLRISKEIEYFKNHYVNVYVIGVYATDATCYTRIKSRKFRRKFKSLKEFTLIRLNEDYAHGLGYIYHKMLDYIVDNDTDNLPSLKKRINSIIKKIEYKSLYQGRKAGPKSSNMSL